MSHDFASSSSSMIDSLITIPNSDIIRLILVYLMENNLHETCRTLHKESGIGLCSSLHVPQFWYHHCNIGDYVTILNELSLYDKDKIQYYYTISPRRRRNNNKKQQQQTMTLDWIIASIHEMIILELAENDEWEMAYATYRLVQSQLNDVMVIEDENDGDEVDDENDDNNEANNDNNDDDDGKKKKKKKKKNKSKDKVSNEKMNISRLLEIKLADLANQRIKEPNCAVPTNYYYNMTKQNRRQLLGNIIEEIIPRQPKHRLISLLQQSIKWQSYTGQLPRIKRLLIDDEEVDELKEEEEVVEESHKKEKKKDKKKMKTIKEFDLILGEIDVDPITVGTYYKDDTYYNNNNNNIDTFILDLDIWSIMKFGKTTVPECAIFTTDISSGVSIITGSSDGFIEIWDSNTKYTTLRIHDLPYQKKEQLLSHDHNDKSTSITALAISRDNQFIASGDNYGYVNIWNFYTGTLLRSIVAYSSTTGNTAKSGSSTSSTNAIMCLAFPPDGSRILTGGLDGRCREFGLRTSKMLKEFDGHTSYITSCYYQIQFTNTFTNNQGDDVDDNILSSSSALLVITSSGDGTVRIWDGTTADIKRILRPSTLPLGKGLQSRHMIGSTIMADMNDFVATSISENNTNCPTIHTVLHLHRPNNTMIIIPRSPIAYLVNYQGIIIMTFQDINDSNSMNNCFVCGTINPTNNRWLYLIKEDGCCCIFDLSKIQQQYQQQQQKTKIKSSGNIRNDELALSSSSLLVRTIPDFGRKCTTTSKSKDDNRSSSLSEISMILHHPSKNIIGSFSNDKTQKKGQIVLWR